MGIELITRIVLQSAGMIDFTPEANLTVAARAYFWSHPVLSFVLP